MQPRGIVISLNRVTALICAGLSFAGCKVDNPVGGRAEISAVERMEAVIAGDLAARSGAWISYTNELVFLPQLRVQRVFAYDWYCQGLRRLDFRGVPKDFELAYVEHIQAWEQVARAVRDNNGLGALAKVMVPLFLGEGGVLMSFSNAVGLGSELEQAQKRVNETWDRVELVGRKYGVQVPR